MTKKRKGRRKWYRKKGKNEEKKERKKITYLTVSSLNNDKCRTVAMVENTSIMWSVAPKEEPGGLSHLRWIDCANRQTKTTSQHAKNEHSTHTHTHTHTPRGTSTCMVMFVGSARVHNGCSHQVLSTEQQGGLPIHTAESAGTIGLKWGGSMWFSLMVPVSW